MTRRSRFSRASAAALAAVVLGLFAPSPAPVGAANEPLPARDADSLLPRVDWTGLSPEQIDAAETVLRENACACGCGMRLAVCLIKDARCTTSPRIAGVLISSLRQGATIEQATAMMIASVGARASAPDAAARPPALAAMAVPIVLAGAPTRGAITARITLVVFSDFQCEHCAGAALWVDSVATAFPRDVRIVFKHYPLDFHANAMLAARAAVAAHEQGRFWPMHDQLFAHGQSLDRDDMVAWAQQLGLDVTEFTKTLDSDHSRLRVEQDVAEGDRIGVDSTPTFFLNGRRYEGARSLGAIGPVIEGLLHALDPARPLPATGTPASPSGR